jgi:hypothetical protein
MIIVRNKISFFVLFLLFCTVTSFAQTLGGNSVFHFLNLPQSPQLSALGGIHISSSNGDLGMAVNNPSLLRKENNAELNFSFNSFSGNRFMNAFGALHDKGLETSFGMGIQYLSYGTLISTDDAGNEFGEFRPRDMVVQLTASRQYSNRIHYGIALKYIHSSYGIYRSGGLAMDAGIHYADSSGWQASLLLKNMGAQISAYMGTEKGDLPFDIQAGITKKLLHAPLQFSLTLHHLQRINILYNDSVFNDSNGEVNREGFFSKAIRHAVVSAQVLPSKNVEISIGYNFLRRAELVYANSQNGLSGFSFGVGILFKKFNLRYARSVYQKNIAFNQVGMNLQIADFSL